MAGVPFNFPDTPTQDQEVTAVGGIVYIWDGVKWVSGAAPLVYLPLVGGSMVGPLLLARDPVLPMEAATMQWTQNLVASHSGIPAGATTQVQFNNSGAFGASSNFTFDSTIPGVSIGGYPFTHRTFNVIGPAGIATGGEPGPGGIVWIQDSGANAGLLIGVANPATPQENAWLQAYGSALDEVAPLVLQPAGLSNVGVGKFPDYPLDVAGDVNLTAGSVYRINGVPLAIPTPPAGADRQIQYNNNGIFGASANLAFYMGWSPALVVGGSGYTPPTNVIGTAQLFVRANVPSIRLQSNWPSDDQNNSLGSITWDNVNLPAANQGAVSIRCSTPPTGTAGSRGGALVIYTRPNGGNAPAPAMKIDENQRCGIGNWDFTNTLTYRLNVSGDVDLTGGVYRINGVPLATGNQTPWLSDIDGAGYRLFNTGAVAIGMNSENFGQVEINTMSPRGTGIMVKLNGLPSFALNPQNNGAWIMYDNVLGSWTPSLTGSRGNIGIGVNDPHFKIDVFGGNLGTSAWANNVNFLNLYNGNGNTSYLQFYQYRWTDGTSWNTASTRIMQFTDGVPQAFIEFNPPNGEHALAFGTANFERIRITSGGFVGINTTNPAYTLDIAGGSVRAMGARSYFAAGGEPFAVGLAYDPGAMAFWLGVEGGYNFVLSNASGTACLRIDGTGNTGIAGNLAVGSAPNSSKIYTYSNGFNPGGNVDSAIRTEGSFGGGYLLTDSGESSGMWGYFGNMQIGFPKWGPLGQIHIQCLEPWVTFLSPVRFRRMVYTGTGGIGGEDGDLWVTRESNETAGVIYLGNSQTHYLYFTGSQYIMPAADLFVNGVHVPSDVRIKDNIRPMSEDPLALLSRLNFVEFENNGLGGSIKGRKGIGLVAQEVKEVMPDAVGVMHLADAPDDEILTINYQSLYIHALRAIVQLKDRIQKLEAKHDL